VTRSRQQSQRVLEQFIAQHKAADSTPRVLWAGIDETEQAFAKRCPAASKRLVLAIVPHGFAVPPTVRAVELPIKCFRTLHPKRRMRFTVLKGGRGSAKSWSIARVLVCEALATPLSILCCREIQSSIRASVHKLLASQIRSLGLQRWYDIDVRAIVAFNGSTFDFEGLFQNVDRIRSFEAADIVWIEEASNISADSWEILEPTLRKPSSFFVANYNPDAQDAPTHQMFAVAKRPDAIVEHVTYLDNPFVTEPLQKAAEYLRSVDDDAYRHVWLGETRSHSDSQILKGKFSVEEFEPKEDWNAPMFGLDFGFSQDPVAAVKCYVHERTLYVEHEVWQIGCDIDRTPQLLDQIPDARRHTIRADCARPETISYLQRHGYAGCTGVEKWSGSVEDGVAHLRSYQKIVIHQRCEHTIEEARLYSYKVNKLNGDVLPDIADKFNHCMDALRYALAPLIRRSGAGHGLLQWMQDEQAKKQQSQELKPDQSPRDKRDAPGVTVTPLTWQ
jgi:phage terminase large subunit